MSYIGVLKVNKETEREMMIHPSQGKRAVQLFIGFIICLLLVFATGTAAFLASQLKFSQNPASLCRFAPKHGLQMWASCPVADAPGGSCESWPKNGRSDFHTGEELYGCKYWVRRRTGWPCFRGRSNGGVLSQPVNCRPTAATRPRRRSRRFWMQFRLMLRLRSA